MVKINDQAYDWSNNIEIVGHVRTNGVRVVEVSCKVVFHYWEDIISNITATGAFTPQLQQQRYC